MTTQTTLDIFAGTGIPVRLETLDREGTWSYYAMRSDAECIVRDIGKLPIGGTTGDRLMVLGKTVRNMLGRIDPENPVIHYWAHNTGAYRKEITWDGTVTDLLQIHEDGKGWQGRWVKVDSALIDGPLLIFCTEEGEYSMPIYPDSDRNRIHWLHPFDPGSVTEHLLIKAISNGIPLEEIEDLLCYNAVSISYYTPFTRDGSGQIVESPHFRKIMDLCSRLGIQPDIELGPPAWEPDIWPIANRKYCARRKTCDRWTADAIRAGCIGCAGFFVKWGTEISPKDMIDHRKTARVKADRNGIAIEEEGDE